jgi:hypothetical protein
MAKQIRAENISSGDRLTLRKGLGPSKVVECGESAVGDIKVYFADEVYWLFCKDELVEIE